MKYIPFHDSDKFKTRAVIEAVAGGPRQQKVDEMRRRVRILDALEKATTTGMMIEDADHEHLVKIVKEFDFGIAHPELLRVIDDILGAGPPPAIMLPAANGKADDAHAA